jgi:hypothetical protein
MHEDAFDNLEQLRMIPSEMVVPDSIASKKRKQRRRQFTMVPNSWIEDLREARHPSTYRVAFYLLRQHWKSGKESIPVSTVALNEWGVSRRQKWRALAELERLKLVKVVRRPRKAPLVTLLFDKS